MNIVCVSHLRWNFVFQRPQHLLTRAAKNGRVLYVEEPFTIEGPSRMEVTIDAHGVAVAVPHLSASLGPALRLEMQRQLLRDAVRTQMGGAPYVLWYYTPLALEFTAGLSPVVTVYDCMDELSAFDGARADLAQFERQLFARADVVFTGGQSLFEAKRPHHHNVHALPSSVDVAHFGRARTIVEEPPDQAMLARPRIGFFGVIDERFDIVLVDGVARMRPGWQLVLVGPTVKVDPERLPRAANIHYLGAKSYADLPSYIAGWDVAMLPFARNQSTRFISPTKTPEYLAAGKPVISTSIRDVVRPYGERGLARIADDPASFVVAVENALRDNPSDRLRAADAFLAHLSWDETWRSMRQRILEATPARPRTVLPSTARPHVSAAP